MRHASSFRQLQGAPCPVCRAPFTDADEVAFLRLADSYGLEWQFPLIPSLRRIEAPQAPDDFVPLCCPRMLVVDGGEMVESRDRRMRFQPPLSYICFGCGKTYTLPTAIETVIQEARESWGGAARSMCTGHHVPRARGLVLDLTVGVWAWGCLFPGAEDDVPEISAWCPLDRFVGHPSQGSQADHPLAFLEADVIDSDEEVVGADEGVVGAEEVIDVDLEVVEASDVADEMQILSEIAARAEAPDVAEEMVLLSEIARRSEED